MVVNAKVLFKFSLLVLIFFPRNSSLQNTKTSKNCGIPYEPRVLSYGGNEAGRYDHPWKAALTIMNEVGNDKTYLCGGVLIDSETVITAAHCIVQTNGVTLLARDITVLLGAHNLESQIESGRLYAAVDSIKIHSSWNPFAISYDGDIALLHLADPVGFTRFIRPVCLADQHTSSLVNGTVVSWGAYADDSITTSNVPRKIEISIIEPFDCVEKSNALLPIFKRSTMFCAGREGTGLCYGDSGSGFYFKQNGTFYIKGIVSTSVLKKCSESDLTLFTDILKYEDFIKKDENHQGTVDYNMVHPVHPTYYMAQFTTPRQSSTSPDNTTSEEGENFLRKKPKYPENELSNAIARSVLNFSKKLIQRVLSKTSNSYEVVSPISLSSSLQLALLGSRGETFDELIGVLNLNDTLKQHPYKIHNEFGGVLHDLVRNEPSHRNDVPWRYNAPSRYIKKFMKFQDKKPNSEEHSIEVANGIFFCNSFSLRPEYVDAVKNVYQSHIQRKDFQGNPLKSAKEINQWMDAKTHGKITDILPPAINPNTRVLLTNSLYFNADWQVSFIEGATVMKKFYHEGRAKSDQFIETELMAHDGLFPHHYDAELDCDILGLPYKQNATTMYVLMPKTSNPTSLRNLQQKLTAERFESMVNKMSLKTAVILFPKMHLTSGLHLKTELKDMGVESLFSEDGDLAVMAGILPDKKEFEFDSYYNVLRLLKVKESQPRPKRDVTYKAESEYKRDNPLTMKDFALKQRISKKNSLGKKLKRSKRAKSSQYYESEYTKYTRLVERIRKDPRLQNPGLFADEFIHKVVLTINEKGTEGGAAVANTLNRNKNVIFQVNAPFMFVIRHDPTHIALFYGVVFKPKI